MTGELLEGLESSHDLYTMFEMPSWDFCKAY
jgi:hypothetical protein